MRRLTLFSLLCLLVWSGLFAQDSPVAQTDSFSELIEYYDSLLPDSLRAALDSVIQDSLANAALDSIDISSSEPQIVDDRIVPEKLESGQRLWAFLMLLLVSVLVGVTRFVNPGIHDGLLGKVFKFKRSDGDYEPRSDVKTTILVLFFIVQCLIFGFGLFTLTEYDTLFTFDAGILDYLLIITILLLAFLLKYFAYRFTGDVLEMSTFSGESLSFLVPLGYMCALFLLPILALVYYNSAEWIQLWGLWYILGILTAYFILRSLKLIVTSYRNFSFHKIYLFIYLCAVEILPALLLVNLLVDFN